MNIDNLAKSLSFQKGKHNYYKIIDDYLFTLGGKGDLYFCVILNHSFSKEMVKEISSLIGVKKVSVHTVYSSCDTLRIILPYSFLDTEKAYSRSAEIVKTLISYFSNCNIKCSNRCFFCGEDSDEVIDINNFVTYGHKECLVKYKEGALNQIEELEKNSGKFTTSLILSFVGALLGVVPTILTLILFSTYYSILFILPPFLSFIFYKIGGAVIDKKATIFSIVFSLIAVIAFYFVTVILSLEQLSFSSFINGVFSTLGDLLTIILFYVLGIVFSYRFISNNLSRKKKDIENL